MRCKKCKSVIEKAVHPELGRHSYCKCQSELFAEFDKSLWESEKCYIDMSLLQFTAIGIRRIKKMEPDDELNLAEVLVTAHQVLEKIDLINRKCKSGDKIVDFTENGLVIDKEIVKKLEVSAIRLYNLSDNDKIKQNKLQINLNKQRTRIPSNKLSQTTTEPRIQETV